MESKPTNREPNKFWLRNSEEERRNEYELMELP